MAKETSSGKRKSKTPAGRRVAPGVPPALAEDAAELEFEAGGAGADSTAPELRRGSRGTPSRGKRGASREPDGPAAPAPIEFPIESLALLHLELWNWIGRRLRSKWVLEPAAAQEMAKHADLVLRQYIGPWLAEHAALATYSLTQLTAVMAILSSRETRPAASPAAPAAPAPAPLDPLANRKPEYHEPVTMRDLRPA